MFEKIGNEPQWRVVYEHIRNLDAGTMVTMKQLQNLLPNAPEGSVRTAFHRAMKEMETVDHRSFVTEWGIGYRVASANEHEKLARRQQKFARRRLDAGLRKIEATDRSQLTSDELRRLDSLEEHVRRTRSFIRQVERRKGGVMEPVAEQSGLSADSQGNLKVTEDGLSKLNRLLATYNIKPEGR